jgi:hypothetical protein
LSASFANASTQNGDVDVFSLVLDSDTKGGNDDEHVGWLRGENPNDGMAIKVPPATKDETLL